MSSDESQDVASAGAQGERGVQVLRRHDSLASDDSWVSDVGQFQKRLRVARPSVIDLDAGRDRVAERDREENQRGRDRLTDRDRVEEQRERDRLHRAAASPSPERSPRPRSVRRSVIAANQDSHRSERCSSRRSRMMPLEQEPHRPVSRRSRVMPLEQEPHRPVADTRLRARSLPPQPAEVRRPRSSQRAVSTPVTASGIVCTVCGEALLLGEQRFKWYNEHQQCGNTKRMFERQLVDKEHFVQPL